MGEFDNCWDGCLVKSSNFNKAISKLESAGFSEEYLDNFKIILWDIPNTYYNVRPQTKFEDLADTPNFYYFSGYDPSIISFLLEGKQCPPRNAEELMETALNQELLNRVELS